MTRLAVLCVDDERIVLNGLKDQLRRHFSDAALIETAESGEEGLQVFDELREEGTEVPVVISDQLMPGMKGEAFLASIHERAPSTLSILLTGQATVQAVGEAVNRARLYRYLSKPWAETDLVMTVTEALRTWRQGRELETQREELRRAHAASLRFVPQELLALLGHERLVDVTFGDHAVRELSILFSDMRGFTAIIEGKAPADAFKFVNDYMQVLERPIREHDGFIVNIEGDAVLALFPADPDQAIRAGIASHRGLRRFNDARRADGEPPVRMGVGVHTGWLLLGTIGGDERLQCDVVGDAVNATSRIEALTKLYGTEMLVSDAAVDALADPGAFRLREVDRVTVHGKSLPMTLYEVLDALEDDVAGQRLATQSDFSAGRAAFREGRLAEACAHFQRVHAQDPDDASAALHLRRCEHLEVAGLPVDWDGTTVLERK